MGCGFYAGTSFNHFTSPLRAADMSLIHLCCFVYGRAVARGALFFIVANAFVNLASAAWLIWRVLHGVPGTKRDSYRIIGCVLVYSLAMLWYGDWINYMGLLVSYAVGGFIWSINEALHGWGHGLFHVTLVPCLHCLMRSIVAV